MPFVLALLEIVCTIFAFFTICFVTIAKVAGKLLTGLFNPKFDDDPENDESDPDPRPPSIDAMSDGCYWTSLLLLLIVIVVLLVFTIGWILGPFRKIASSNRLDKERKFYEEVIDTSYPPKYTGQGVKRREAVSTVASMRLYDLKMAR